VIKPKPLRTEAILKIWGASKLNLRRINPKNMASRHRKFVLKKGQIDYRRRTIVPVVNCLLMHRGRLLLVKRTHQTRFYPGYWHCIAGFLDDNKNVLQKAREEIYQETGIRRKDIVYLKSKKIVSAYDHRYRKQWIIHYVLAQVKTEVVKLDWEATEYKWVRLDQFCGMRKLIPAFKINAMRLLQKEGIKKPHH